MSSLLAIDYGSKRIGIAITDSNQKIASPLMTLDTKNALHSIEQLLKKYFVLKIIVGYPKQTNGQPSIIVDQIERFVETLKKRFPKVIVVYHQEWYTSKMAKRVLINSGVSKKKRRDKSLIDKISASILLESYLDSLQYKK
ncbi:MAG: Holliday junction resolvase RuvX [Flavobacteriaceae bacterium]|nr:Holliday junction resolvase RuvX [Flavobacteriaceae bacterium]